MAERAVKHGARAVAHAPHTGFLRLRFQPELEAEYQETFDKAAAMLRLASDPAAGVALGARARDDVLAHHAPQRRVQELRTRLTQLRGAR